MFFRGLPDGIFLGEIVKDEGQDHDETTSVASKSQKTSIIFQSCVFVFHLNVFRHRTGVIPPITSAVISHFTKALGILYHVLEILWILLLHAILVCSPNLIMLKTYCLYTF